MKTATDFKNGDRVIYKPTPERKYPSEDSIGMKATIVDSETGLIQFDKPCGGHNACGVPDGTGWYVSLKEDLVRAKRGRPKNGTIDTDEALLKLAKSLKEIDEVDFEEVILEVKEHAKRLKLKREAEKYFDFGESYELGMMISTGPMYIRYGLANPGFEGRELGFYTEDYDVFINDERVPQGAVLRFKKK